MRALAPWLLVSPSLALAGCQLSMGAAGSENMPRRASRARVAVSASTPELGPATLAALARQPGIQAALLPAGGADGHQPPQAACARAASAGFDYLADAVLSRKDAGTTCVQPALAMTHDCVKSAPLGPSYVVVTLRIWRTATCGPRSSFDRTAVERVRPPPEAGVAVATAAVLAQLPRAFADLLPEQVVLDVAGRIQAPAGAGRVPDGPFVVYRGGKQVGALAVSRAGAPDERRALLVCCFSPQPGDVLLHAEPRVLEVSPSFSGAQLVGAGGRRTALGYGFTLDARSLDGGWQGGVELDQLFTSRTNQVLGTIEAGWGFRPAPRWALSLLAGGGGSFIGHLHPAPGEADGSAVHVLGLARAQVQGPQWFLRLDAGYVLSRQAQITGDGASDAFQLRGLLFRLGGGLL